MGIFKASEIYQFAIRIEENGEKFYRKMAEKLENANMKKVFTYLADEEVKHKKTFEDMVSKVEKYEPPESYPGEYFAYLRAYADNIIFSQEKLEEEMSKIKGAISAIDFAIQQELDSILYYLEIKNLVLGSQRSLINGIIEEERRHFVKLSGLKKAMK
ncbi:MAG: ferritin family protein [candidate division WOR-3 bacterium]|nr:ferritin family protein [candidate division WOR-3 bacterium]